MMSASPQSNGTTALCFLPYRRKPVPIEPNNSPRNSDDSLKVLALSYWRCAPHQVVPSFSRRLAPVAARRGPSVTWLWFECALDQGNLVGTCRQSAEHR